MRWIFITCILLAATANVLSRPRQKRDLTFIKSFITSTLFGTETIVVQEPEIPKNETYQIFKIKGYDNILLKVIRKKEPEKEEQKHEVKYQDPVIVSPDIAIIGSYLGTTTEGETLLAIERAKNLLQSGILSGRRDKVIEEVVVPMTPKLPYNYYVGQELIKPQNILPVERDPVYVKAEPIQVVNRQPFPVLPEYPPIVVASEVKYRPVNTKYSYEQKGETGDTLFESYNNQDVIVTRTTKVPPLPQFIKLRFAEVASIGVNPYFRTKSPVGVAEEIVQPMNLASPYGYVNPSMVVQDVQSPPIPWYMMERLAMPPQPAPIGVVEDSGYVIANNINRPPVLVDRHITSESTVPDFIKHSSLPFDIRNHLNEAEVDKLNLFINGKLSKNIPPTNANLKTPSNPKVLKDNPIKVIGKDDENFSVITNPNGQIVTKYLYKQINHNNHDNFTVVKVEDPSNLSKNSSAKTNVLKSTDLVPKDFIFVPPENVDIPPPNMIPKANEGLNNMNSYKDFSERNDELNTKKVNTATLKTSDLNSLKNRPVVALEHNSNQNQVKSFTRGKPGRSDLAFTGGPVF